MGVVLQNIETASSSHTIETGAQIILMRSSRMHIVLCYLRRLGEEEKEEEEANQHVET